MASHWAKVVFVACLGFAASAGASHHTWQITELYSSSDGSVQYVEMHTSFNFEQFLGSSQARLRSKNTAETVTFGEYLFSGDSPAPSGGHHILIGTANLASVAGVTPDFVLPAELLPNFLQIGGGRLELFSPSFQVINFTVYPALPGGTTAWHGIALGLGTPTNYAGVVGELPTIVPGDFDGDGDVDGADFVVWQTNFPTSSGAMLDDGDADGDGDVDGADFVVWQTNFPTTPGGASAALVPEPASCLTMLIGGAILAVYWRSRRRQ